MSMTNGFSLHRVGLSTMAVLLLCLPGCPAVDPSDEGFEGGTAGYTGGGTPMLPGVRVKCCYQLFKRYPTPDFAQGCTYTERSICVDPDEYGELAGQTLVNLCNRKCPSDGLGSPNFTQLFHEVGDENKPLSLLAPYDGCEAIPLGGVILDDQDEDGTEEPVPCTPVPSQLEPWTIQPDGSYGGRITSRRGNGETQVTVNGERTAIEYEGDVEIAINDCSEEAPGQLQCSLVLQRLVLDLGETTRFGRYVVDRARLSLVDSVETDVAIQCESRRCTGTFAFDSGAGSAIDLDLTWAQTNLETGAVGSGALLLSSRPGGLGGMTVVDGLLELDESLSSGTVRLLGRGSDAFGGSIATASFDLEGTVDPMVR